MAPDTSGQNTDLTSPSYAVSDLKDRLREAKSQRDRFIPDWYLNLAFFLGEQWLYWNRGRLDRPHLADHRETIVDNRILPVVTSRAARKTKNRPIFTATPYTADESDVGSARIAERILDSDWNNLCLTQKLFQALMFAEICGAGFWKIYWDSTQGDSASFVFYEDGQPMLTAEGAPIKVDTFMSNGGLPAGTVAQMVAVGDACVEVCSPFELYPSPLATSIEDAEWLIEEKVRSQEYVLRRYKVKLPLDTEAPVGPVESRLFSSAFYGGGGSGQNQGIKVYEFWSRPSTEFPQGKRCVWAADQLLAEDDAPFDPMPYVMFSGVRVPNRFWPTSITTQLRGPQTELNKVRSQIQENANRIGNPALMKSRQANVYYSGVPGEEVLYDSTVTDAVPTYLQPPEVPVYVREEVQRIVDSITEISGMHEVSKAQVPSGVTAASAINLLQEADDTRLGPEIQDMEASLSKAGSKLLKLRAQFNTDERIIRIAGEDGVWDIFKFRGSQLGNSTDVEVQAGSAFPRSKAAKQAAMQEILALAFQYGVPLDPRSLRRFFKDYEVAGLERLFDNISNDELQVNREHRLMSQGQPVPINSWDNDQFHVEAHDDFRKTEQFSAFGDAVKTIFDIHVRAHRERMVQQVNLQMQAQGAEQQDQMQQSHDMQLQQQSLQNEARYQLQRNQVRQTQGT